MGQLRQLQLLAVAGDNLRRFEFVPLKKAQGLEYDLGDSADLFNQIEVFYNRKRRYSYLGQISPVEFEKLSHGSG